MIWIIVWVVLMILWLVFGCYVNRDPARRAELGGTLIPWACVLILGLFVFGAFGPAVFPR